MDIAIVTGASSSLGLAISSRLIQMGFRVYGLGGDYTDCSLKNVNFKPFPCDLADPEAVEAAAQNILKREKGVFVLINNAKYYGKKSFFEADRSEIERILNINLLCPLILTRALADSLASIQGFIIQLGSTYAETSRGGPVGAAASGGLKWMGEVLFHDLRDHGVKVCHLSPDPNRGRDPRTVARPGARIESAIDPEAVAQAVEQILQSRFGNIVTEMVLRPLRVSEPDYDPVVRFPYPKPMPVPYTVPREMIEAEEQLETEEYERKENLRRKQRQSGQRGQPKKEEPEKDEKVEKDSDKKESANRPKRSRKSRPARKQATRKQPDRDRGQEKPLEKPKPDTPPEKKEAPTGKPQQEAQPEQSSGSRRRRSRRKPRPPMTSVGFLNREKEHATNKQDKTQAQSETNTAAKASPAESPKKATKKAVKRAAKKSTSTKKAAKKVATTKKATPRKRTAKKTANKDASKSD